jgi:hypothetical protein
MGFFSDILNKITGKTKVGANLAEKQDLNNDSFISEDMVAELEADLG